MLYTIFLCKFFNNKVVQQSLEKHIYEHMTINVEIVCLENSLADFADKNSKNNRKYSEFLSGALLTHGSRLCRQQQCIIHETVIKLVCSNLQAVQ